jgi:hypothetical protein
MSMDIQRVKKYDETLLNVLALHVQVLERMPKSGCFATGWRGSLGHVSSSSPDPRRGHHRKQPSAQPLGRGFPQLEGTLPRLVFRCPHTT